MEESTDSSWPSPHTHIVLEQEMGSSGKIRDQVTIIKEIISVWLIFLHSCNYSIFSYFLHYEKVVSCLVGLGSTFTEIQLEYSTE